MKLEIDWAGMLKAALKAIWPFIAGAVGGLFTGCTIAGIGPNFILRSAVSSQRLDITF